VGSRNASAKCGAYGRHAYKRGGFALIDYLNALQDDRTTTLDALDADAQTWMAIHQLSYASVSAMVVP
jgi:outer membrane protein, heavy metal efflux system